MVTVADVRALALTLPRTTEHLIRDRVKFRVKQIVYCAFSRDETIMGFAFPKEERAALVAGDPDRFLMPARSDERYHWVQARLGTLREDELAELIFDAWCRRKIERVTQFRQQPSGFGEKMSARTRDACRTDYRTQRLGDGCVWDDASQRSFASAE